MPFSSSQALIDTLSSSHDFLTITREHEWRLGQSGQFNVTHNTTGEEIVVNVIETGLITFEPVF